MAWKCFWQFFAYLAVVYSRPCLYLQVGTGSTYILFWRSVLISKNGCISDIREVKSLLSEIVFNSLNIALPSNESDKYHISRQKYMQVKLLTYYILLIWGHTYEFYMI